MNQKALLVALSFYGEQPIPGYKANPQILEFLAATSYPLFESDEVPWCSAFMIWCYKQANIEVSANAAARSWLAVGERTDNPKLGDIVVIGYPRENPANFHVGFFIRETTNLVYVLAGNQNDTVDITPWRKRSVLEYRVSPGKAP